VGTKDDEGWIALHCAALEGHPDAVALLIDKGSDVNAQENSGETPLHWAAGMGHEDVVGLLIARGADVNAQNISGETPLHWAGKKEPGELTRLIGKHGIVR